MPKTWGVIGIDLGSKKTGIAVSLCTKSNEPLQLGYLSSLSNYCYDFYKKDANTVFCKYLSKLIVNEFSDSAYVLIIIGIPISQDSNIKNKWQECVNVSYQHIKTYFSNNPNVTVVSQNEYGTTLKAHISFLENNRKVIAANSDFSSNCNISFSHFNKQKDSLSAIEIIKLYFENKKLFLKNIMQCINN